jgi:hypothetical protein
MEPVSKPADYGNVRIYVFFLGFSEENRSSFGINYSKDFNEVIPQNGILVKIFFFRIKSGNKTSCFFHGIGDSNRGNGDSIHGKAVSMNRKGNSMRGKGFSNDGNANSMLAAPPERLETPFPEMELPFPGLETPFPRLFLAFPR